MNNIVLIDIMEKGRFVTQVKYTGKPFPMICENREVVLAHRDSDLMKFVYEKYPSLVRKNITFQIANQRVFSN